MNDLYNSVLWKRGLSPVSDADNTALTTQILDTKGFAGAFLLLLTGSIADADATFAVTLAESDASNMSGSNAVDSSKVVGGTLTAAGFQFDDDNEIRKLLVMSTKRYIQATITPTGNASAALVAGAWGLVDPKYAAVTQADA